jgi:F1F0 ATPase subunit 2
MISLLDIQTISLAVMAFGVGGLLGFVYFMGLWQTVQKMTLSRSPARVVVVSFVLRTAMVLVGFYVLMGAGHWERLVAALMGFILMRKILTDRKGPRQAVSGVDGRTRRYAEEGLWKS